MQAVCGDLAAANGEGFEQLAQRGSLVGFVVDVLLGDDLAAPQ